MSLVSIEIPEERVEDRYARQPMESNSHACDDLTSSVMNSLSSSIAVLDRQGRIIRVNDAWQRFAASNGGNPLLQGVIGQDYLDLCWRAATREPQAARALAGLDAVLAGELSSFVLEYSCAGPHKERWCMMQVRPLVGAVPGLLVSYQDISQRKLVELDLAAHKDQLERLVAQRTRELENARAQAELILESTADGIFGLDMQGQIIFINPAACAMLGYPESGLIGRQAHQMLHHTHADGCPFPATDCSMLDALREGQAAHVDTEVFWRADGTSLPVAYATQPMVVEGKTVGAVVSFQDISIQRAAEKARENLLAEAQHLAKVKSEFLANMSHEIRTPLSAILGLARIGARENIGRKTGETCQKIVDAGQHLLGVINDILDFSKIDAGKLRIEARPFRLHAVIDAVLGFVAESAQAKQINLSFQAADTLPTWVLGDPLRLQQILTNLIANAVKFTQYGHVTLIVDGEPASTQIRFQVIDTGIGMNAGQVARLFGAFEQADSSTTRQYGGTGLGLAISQRLAHLMDGDIAVDSRPGAGSTFTLSLPLPASASGIESAGLPAGETRRLAGLRLLAADDIEVNRLILDDLLAQEGASTAFANDGQQLLALLDEHGSAAFDAVLIDVQMPVMDGYTATQKIRTMAPALPVIGLTAHALPEEREKCLAAGMVEHVTKPIDLDRLVDTLLRHTQRLLLAPAIAIAVPPAPTFTASQIDWPALRTRFRHKAEFLRRLTVAVQSSHGESSAKLTAAAVKQDFATITFIAHGLKSTGGHLFARALFDLARITENAAQENHPEAISLAGRLASLCEAFIAELDAGTKILKPES